MENNIVTDAASGLVVRNTDYLASDIDFGGNDVVIDVMGNVGVFQNTPNNVGSVHRDTISLDNDESKFVSPTSTSSLTNPELYGNEPRLSQPLRYPLHQTNNHFVRFFVNVDEESTLITQNQVQFENRPVDYQDQNRANVADNSVLQTNLKAASSILGGMVAASAAKHLFAGKYQAQATGIAGVAGAVAGSTDAFKSIATESLKLSKKLKRLKTSITLYAPASIATNHYANYDLSEDKLARLLNSDIASEVTNLIRSPSEVASVTGKLGRILASTNSTVSTLSRTAYNPKKDLLFKSMGNRSFQFEFQFAPSSSEEAIAVKDIIYAFKLFSHPEVLKGYGQFLYLYPAEFDIKYGYFDDKGVERENTALNKISSCVLESISVNYGSQGSFQSLENGEPIITNMSLRFKEIETLTQERIKQGY